MIAFSESWLLKKCDDEMHAPSTHAEDSEVLARSSSTGYNCTLTVNAVIDNLFGKKHVVSKHPWLRIETSTAVPSSAEFSYIPYFEKLRDATVSSDCNARRWQYDQYRCHDMSKGLESWILCSCSFHCTSRAAFSKPMPSEVMLVHAAEQLCQRLGPQRVFSGWVQVRSWISV